VHSEATVPNRLDQMFHQATEELRRRLEAGHPAPAESILQDFSALGEIETRAIALIEREWRWRRDAGEIPDLDAFCQRFPALESGLRRRLRGGDSSDEQPAFTTVAEPSEASGSLSVESTQPLPEHQVFEEIGVGGMGKVFCAFDPVLERYVALKVIRTGSLATNEEVKRFYREARTAAKLNHRHIIRIHGMGLHQSEHSFTMALATGGNLTSRRAQFTEPRAASELLLKISAAVAHAHDRGIIHRDLKPANILFDAGNEPLVTDFGLAKALSGSEELTIQGQVLGTPAYMAPEQARGALKDIGPHSDVWSLGVILYELVTGHKPFRAESNESLVHKVIGGTYPAPETLNPSLDPSLCRIIRQCMQQEPRRRYADAGLLHEDLQRWLNGQSIHPLAPSPLKTAERSWYGKALAAAVSLLVVVGVTLGIAIPFWLREPVTSSTESLPERRQPRALIFPDKITHGEGRLVRDENGTTTLESTERAWIVLDDPGMPIPYRYIVDLEDLGTPSSQVGIFWDYHRRIVQERETWWYTLFSFSEAKRTRPYEGKSRNTGWMRLEEQRQVWNEEPSKRAFLGWGQQFFPFSVDRGCIRQITIEVRPGTSSILWKGSSWSVVKIDQQDAAESFKSLAILPPLLEGKHPPLGAGKLGVYCEAGTVRFHKSRVEPIEDSD